MHEYRRADPPRRTSSFVRFAPAGVASSRTVQLRNFNVGPADEYAAGFSASLGTTDPYLDYGRFLTPEGGVLIVYKDLDLRWRHTLWRLLAWSAATSFAGWYLRHESPVQAVWLNVLCFVAIALLNWLIVAKPVEVYRRIEVRPDCLILEGIEVFWRERMEGGLPMLRPDEDSNQILCGVYGTRFVEYGTLRRFDEFDRMPETFAAHLAGAIEQLWQ